jgi:hypothetical protein
VHTYTIAAVRVSLGFGGWCRVTTEHGVFYARLRDDDGRLSLVELYLEDGPITATTVRRLPLAQLERWANNSAVRDVILYRAEIPGPDLATAASFFATSFTPSAQHWVADMMRSQIDGTEVARPPRRTNAGNVTNVPSEPPDPRLSARPAGSRAKPYDDAFYREVADKYTAIASQAPNPAARISDANGVPVTTVHRWVREARRRGFLPPAAPGKAG